MADYVTASELGEYVYCKRAWWLHQHRFTGENAQMLAGIKAHNQLYSQLRFSQFIKTIAIILLVIGISLVVLVFLLK
jgi:hypothetical protein